MFARKVVIIFLFVLSLVMPAFARTVVLPLGLNPSLIAKRDTTAAENWRKFTFINPKNGRVIVFINPKTHRLNGRDRFLPPGTLVVEPDDLVTVEAVEVNGKSLVDLCKGYVNAGCVTILQRVNRIHNQASPFTAKIQVPRNFEKVLPAPVRTPKAVTKSKTNPQPAPLNIRYLGYFLLGVILILCAWLWFRRHNSSNKGIHEVAVASQRKIRLPTFRFAEDAESLRKKGLLAIAYVNEKLRWPSLPKLTRKLTTEELEELHSFCANFTDFVKNKASPLPVPGEAAVVTIQPKIKRDGLIEIKVFPTGKRVYPNMKLHRGDSFMLDNQILKEPFALNFKRAVQPRHVFSWRNRKSGVLFSYKREKR